MEHWHSARILPHQSQDENERQILVATSGNAQSQGVEVKDGVENQDPVSQAPDLSQSQKPESLYPAPILTLRSNDRGQDGLRRLEARRRRRDDRYRRRLGDPRMPYLEHPKYLNYRARPRRDTGSDGKPVWDDRIEEAFQNALIHIEPMGKRKRSQNNRPYGRNELIAEWIYHETGAIRTRKQVSSHIQVLNGLLKGIPEWDAVITAIDDNNFKTSRSGYYENSIQHLVERDRRAHERKRNGYASDLPPPALPLSSNTNGLSGHHLAEVSFHMWVSLPNQMDSALHNYTRLQNHQCSSADSPLESLRNWRATFPQLCSIVESWSPHERCDIVLLETSFQLMPDFPPRFSKLGISLELDFLHPNSDPQALAALREWSCITHMYQHGKLVNQVAYDDCHVPSLGKVKPFFESKWWASTFTQLTEKKRRAEDSKNEAAIQAANEASHNFFQGLSVVQEIFAGPASCNLKLPVQGPGVGSGRRSRERMAILLWRFSQAQRDYVGTTTWRKLLPPPDRITTNSPSPSGQEMLLPPLIMDTMIQGETDPNFETNHCHFSTQPNFQLPSLYSSGAEDELCQDGFMAFKEEDLTTFAALHESEFSLTDPQLDVLTASHGAQSHEFNPLSFEASLQPHQTVQTAPLKTVGHNQNFFETEIHRTSSQPVTSLHHAAHHNFAVNRMQEKHFPNGHQQAPAMATFHVDSHPPLDTASDSFPARPLTSFDFTTHHHHHHQQLLQAQFLANTRLNVDDNDTDHDLLAAHKAHQDLLHVVSEPCGQSPRPVTVDESYTSQNAPHPSSSSSSFPISDHHQPSSYLAAPIPIRPPHPRYLSLPSPGPVMTDTYNSLIKVATEEEFDEDGFAAALTAHNNNDNDNDDEEGMESSAVVSPG